MAFCYNIKMLIKEPNVKNESLFEEQIFNLLSRFLNLSETLNRTSDDVKYDFYAEKGIEKLGISGPTYFEVRYFFLSSDSLKFIRYLNDIRDRNSVIFITNLPEREINKYNLNLPNNIKIWSINDVVSIEARINNRDDIAYKIKENKTHKSLDIAFLDRYVYFFIRSMVIKKFFSDEHLPITPFLISSKSDDSLWDFNFEYKLKTYKFRYNNKSIIDVEDNLDKELCIFYNIRNVADSAGNFEITFKNGGKFTCNVNESTFFNELVSFASDVGRSHKNERVIYKYKKLFDDVNKNIINPFTKKTIFSNDVFFAPKKYLNDPFDLDIRRVYLAKDPLTMELREIGYDEKDSKFAIFCTTSYFDNILMWSHYGDSHKGICFQYNEDDILGSIDIDPQISFCFYGNVSYSKTRPVFTNLISSGRYLPESISKQIFHLVCLFTKFKDWKYEGERRYIIYSKNSSLQSGLTIHVPYKYCYLGVKLNDLSVGAIESQLAAPCSKLKADVKDYKLFR